MARNASRIKLGYYPVPPAEGARLRRLLDFAPDACAVCARTRAALHQLTEGAQVSLHAFELDVARAAALTASGMTTIHGNVFDTVGKSESVSFLYLNPPYDSEIASMDSKRMEYLFLEHCFRSLAKGGVLPMVVPRERLDAAIPLRSSGKACRHFKGALQYILAVTLDDRPIVFRRRTFFAKQLLTCVPELLQCQRMRMSVYLRFPFKQRIHGRQE